MQFVRGDHYRPARCLERSPFFPDIMVSVGDWDFNIWKEGVPTPLFTSNMAPTYVRAVVAVLLMLMLMLMLAAAAAAAAAAVPAAHTRARTFISRRPHCWLIRLTDLLERMSSQPLSSHQGHPPWSLVSRPSLSL